MALRCAIGWFTTYSTYGCYIYVGCSCLGLTYHRCSHLHTPATLHTHTPPTAHTHHTHYTHGLHILPRYTHTHTPHTPHTHICHTHRTTHAFATHTHAHAHRHNAALTFRVTSHRITALRRVGVNCTSSSSCDVNNAFARHLFSRLPMAFICELAPGAFSCNTLCCRNHQRLTPQRLSNAICCTLCSFAARHFLPSCYNNG